MSFAARMNPSLSFLVIPSDQHYNFAESKVIFAVLLPQQLRLKGLVSTLRFRTFMIRQRGLTRLIQISQFRRHASTKASHTDITSFLTHATSTNLSAKSTYYVATLYEYTVLRALRTLNISLHRTGGTDDRGVDLRGRWLLPPHPHYSAGIPIIVQCKAEKRPIGPKYLRELEGAASAEDTDTLILLATLSRFTEGARRVVMGSERAMGVVVVDGYEFGGEVRQFIWNGAAGRLVGSELGVKTVFDLSGWRGEDEDGVGSKVVLTWNGSIIKTRKVIPGAI